MPENPTIAATPLLGDMFERSYWEIQKVLDETLGTNFEDGAGAGIVADVYAALAKSAADERVRIADWLLTLADTSVDKSRPLRAVLEEISGMIREYRPEGGDRS